jgi:hypothetical protein
MEPGVAAAREVNAMPAGARPIHAPECGRWHGMHHANGTID